MNLLSEYEFPGDDIPVIRGSALKALKAILNGIAKIIELMDAVDDIHSNSRRATDKPFLMPVEDVFSITGRGTVATGRVERGVIKVGEKLKSLVLAMKTKVSCTGVEMFRNY